MQDPTRPEMRLPDASVPELRAQVEAVLQDRDLLQKGHARAVREVVYRLDRGGRSVHLSGGVGLGGVLEPPGARPVIVEEGAFVGSRCIVVEGCLIEEEAVLGAGVVLTASTPIYDVTGPQERVSKGRVPARSIVIPGMRPRSFPAGEYLTPCALIIGQRGESTDKKTSLNQALRDFGVSA